MVKLYAYSLLQYGSLATTLLATTFVLQIMNHIVENNVCFFKQKNLLLMLSHKNKYLRHVVAHRLSSRTFFCAKMKMARTYFTGNPTIFATTQSSQIIVDSSWYWCVKSLMECFICNDMSSQLFLEFNTKNYDRIFDGFSKMICDDMSLQLRYFNFSIYYSRLFKFSNIPKLFVMTCRSNYIKI